MPEEKDIQGMVITPAELKCPHCNAEISGLSLFGQDDGLPPNEGDVSVCWKCNDLMIIQNADPVLRKPTPDERKQIIKEEPGLADILRMNGVKLQ